MNNRYYRELIAKYSDMLLEMSIKYKPEIIRKNGKVYYDIVRQHVAGLWWSGRTEDNIKSEQDLIDLLSRLEGQFKIACEPQFQDGDAIV